MTLREQVARALCGNWMFKPWESIVLAYATADKVLAITEADKAAAVEAERARIVAWLRGHSGSYKAGTVADAIERGEHWLIPYA
jgi:hypothetical protein